MATTFLGFTFQTDDFQTLIQQEIPRMRNSEGFKTIVTLNSEMLANASKHPSFVEFASNSLCVADGMGVIAACKWIHGTQLPKITGVDLTQSLLAQNKYRFFLVGGHPETLKEAVNNIKLSYPGSVVVGAHHGYFSHSESPLIEQKISQANPDIVLVGLGFPKQELFLKQLQKKLSQGIGIGVGGTFDILAKTKKRAPRWIQTLCLEWFYRGITDPKRMLRWVFIPNYIKLVFFEWKKARAYTAFSNNSN